MAGKEKLSFDEMLDRALVRDEDKPYEIPENWVWVKLGSLVDIRTGKKDANYGDENGRYYFFTCAAEPIRCNGYSFEGESILLAGNGANVGLALYYDGKFEAYQRTYVLQSSKDISLKYVFYHLTGFWKEYNNDKQYGSATNYIKLGNIQEYPIPLPPLSEQARIVNLIESFFGNLDRAKELVQNAIDSFESRKSAILHKAFKGELTDVWRQENGVDFEKDWEERKLGELCEINPQKIKTNDSMDDLEVSFVPMPAVSDVLGIIETPQVRRLREVKKGYTNFSEGDVIFAKITPCMENGKSAVVGKLVNDIGFGSTEFHVLRCSEKFINRYLYHLVRWQVFRDEARRVMTGAVGQQRVPKTFLEEYTINTPPVKEQYEIVRILDSIFEKEQKANELCSLIENIDHMKKSILVRAFRGELGTNISGEESALKLLKDVLERKNG
jgi:type I restriction enzyme S subunit